MMLPLANSSVECHLFLYIIRIWGYPANIPPSSLLGLKSLVKFKFLIYTESARNLLFRLFRAGKNPYFFGTLSSIQYQDVLGKSTGTEGLKILRRVISVPVRVRPPAEMPPERAKKRVFREDGTALAVPFFCERILRKPKSRLEEWPLLGKCLRKSYSGGEKSRILD